MKIRKVEAEHRARVYALLKSAFSGSSYEANLVKRFHDNGAPLHEWACIQTGKVIAYLAFSNAYRGQEACGLHLAPMAVAPEWQLQGIGSQLLRFALRQEEIREQTLYVLGEPAYYRQFGFETCATPTCPYDKNNTYFLSLRNPPDSDFTVGYAPEFKSAGKPQTARGKARR